MTAVLYDLLSRCKKPDGYLDLFTFRVVLFQRIIFPKVIFSINFSIVSALKILREINNYTQQFVAESILGISQNTYSRLEASPQKITAEQAQKLSRFYKVPVAHLLSGCEPVVSFKASTGDNTNDTTQVTGGGEQAREKELLFLKEELEYFKKQNLELLRLLGETINEA